MEKFSSSLNQPGQSREGPESSALSVLLLPELWSACLGTPQFYEETGTVTHWSPAWPQPHSGQGSETPALSPLCDTALHRRHTNLTESDPLCLLYCYFLIKKMHRAEKAGQRQESLPGPLLPHSGSGE